MTPQLETAKATMIVSQEISLLANWCINLFRIERKIASNALPDETRIVLYTLRVYYIGQHLKVSNDLSMIKPKIRRAVRSFSTNFFYLFV